MELTYTLNPADHRSAQWLNIKPRRSFAVVGIGLLMLVAWTMWFAFRLEIPFFNWGKWMLSGLLAYLFFYSCIFLPWKWNKIFQQQKSLHRESLIRVNESGVEMQSEIGRALVPWSDFLRWKEDKRIFLLYLSDVSFIMIPTRGFEQEQQIVDFREIINRNISGKAS